MSLLVMKFGGNVLSRPDGIHEMLRIIASQRPIWDEIVVVMSALSGITDALQALARTAESGDQGNVRSEIASLRELHIEALASPLATMPTCTPSSRS
ncbi:MAG: hypothetical protein HC915_12855 [Anaerolineae bacterium]|nr:hypothetical protein [Anaerolineae bacterium]